VRRIEPLFYASTAYFRFDRNRLLDGFHGKLTTTKSATIEKCSHDTALREIQDLIEQGLLKKDPGGGRSTSYSLTDA